MKRFTREEFFAPSTAFRGHTGTVSGVLRDAFTAFAERPYLDFSGEQFTFGEADRAARRLAHAYRAAGVERGDRIVSILDNSPASALTFFAAIALDAIHAPLNPALKGRFLAHPLIETEPAVVVCDPHYLARLIEVGDAIPHVSRVLVNGAVPDDIEPGRFELVAAADWLSDDESELVSEACPTDVCLLIYTSGTTGPAKGCMISHNYLYVMANQSTMARENAEPLITPLPLMHINPIGIALVGTAILGSRAAVMPRFSVSRFWPEVERTGAEVATLLGSMLVLLAEAPDNDAALRCKGQLRRVLGAPFPRELQAVWRERFGVGGREGGMGYGLTEISGVTVPQPPGPEDSIGVRHPFVDVRILDDDDHEVERGTVGEICVRPLRPNVMFSGYWRRPDATAAAWRNGYFHTGDLGRQDTDDYFWFVDRKKDYLRRRGENISSTELEAAVREHPGVLEAAIHAVPSDMLEDEVKLTAILMPDADLTEGDLCRWIAERVPYFAVPRFIEFRPDLPRNAAGRVLKFQLREEGATPATWDREAADFELERR